MLEKVGKVSNPLTIVAMFAAIVEVSGSITLPLIHPENQRIYMWFLMIFPFTLILIFFSILVFKNSVLYAPSDWQNEEFFWGRYGKATPEERQAKLDEEIEDEITEIKANASASLEAPSFVPEGDTASPPTTDAADDYFQNLDPRLPGAQVERLRIQNLTHEALNRLADQFGELVREQAVTGMGGRRVIFDGIIRSPSLDWFVEVKHVNLAQDPVSVARRAIHQFSIAYRLFDEKLASRCGFMLVLIVRDANREQQRRVASNVQTESGKTIYPIQLRVFSEKELSL